MKFLFSLIMILGASSAMAAQYTVSSLSQLQHYAASALPGDVIYVAAGTYSVSTTNYAAVTISVSGTASARIKYISSTPWGAKLQVNGTSTAIRITGNYVDLQGFDVSGTIDNGVINSGSHNRIIGNHVHNLATTCTSNGGSGIDMANYSASDNDMIGNVVHNIGTPGSCNAVHGLYHSNSGRIINNVVYANSSYGIHLWHAAQHVTIANNTVFNNGAPISGGCMGGGMVIGDGDSPGGITADYIVVTNNIVYKNGCWGIREYGATGTHNQYVDNLAYGNYCYGGARPQIYLQNGLVATGTVSADPQFVNYVAAGGGDYHLKSTSPAIDAGTSLGALTYDLDNKPRPSGSRYDIGAYEYQFTAIAAASPSPSPKPSPSPSPSPTPAASLSISPSPLAFGNQTVGTTSSVLYATVTNKSTSTVTFKSAFSISGDFAFAGQGTCTLSTALAPGGSCKLSVKFSPTTTGARTGLVQLYTNMPDSPSKLSLSGSGI